MKSDEVNFHVKCFCCLHDRMINASDAKQTINDGTSDLNENELKEKIKKKTRKKACEEEEWIEAKGVHMNKPNTQKKRNKMKNERGICASQRNQRKRALEQLKCTQKKDEIFQCRWSRCVSEQTAHTSWHRINEKKRNNKKNIRKKNDTLRLTQMSNIVFNNATLALAHKFKTIGQRRRKKKKTFKNANEKVLILRWHNTQQRWAVILHKFRLLLIFSGLDFNLLCLQPANEEKRNLGKVWKIASNRFFANGRRNWIHSWRWICTNEMETLCDS